MNETAARYHNTAALEESIQSLGLVTSAAFEGLVLLLPLTVTLHPKTLATAYRKEGEQISLADKRRLGIRANGFLSLKALSEITEKGLEAPLDAHYSTLARAHFTALRLRHLNEPFQFEDGQRLYDSAFIGHCAGCDRLDKQDAESGLPPSDCEKPICALGIRVRYDFTASLLREYLSSRDFAVRQILAGEGEIAMNCLGCGSPFRVRMDLQLDDNTSLECDQCGYVFSNYGTARTAILAEIDKRQTEAAK